jgi:hypothetical protein
MNGRKMREEDLDGGLLYVKLPIPIKAKQIYQPFWVHTLEGNHQGQIGDYLIRGVRGELYICQKDIFEESYRLAEERDE